MKYCGSPRTVAKQVHHHTQFRTECGALRSRMGGGHVHGSYFLGRGTGDLELRKMSCPQAYLGQLIRNTLKS